MKLLGLILDSREMGRLKVSLLGPFYPKYKVIALDLIFKYALIGGISLDYLWVWCKDPNFSEDIKSNYLKI
ncbi:MAG: lipocalin family protein [Saprospiraceae bacterium]|nr:lipocalin family protein [Saprospiraceae bacterium]